MYLEEICADKQLKSKIKISFRKPGIPEWLLKTIFTILTVYTNIAIITCEWMDTTSQPVVCFHQYKNRYLYNG